MNCKLILTLIKSFCTVIKEFSLLCFGILLANFSATGQSNPEVGQRIISRLKTYTSTFTSEKAYLNFDKPYYFPGDTIYFKAYLTAGDRHEISSISRVIYVDLLDRKNKINQFIKLKVNNGVAWGDFALPNTLNGGNYSIVAYTNWMRNDKNFFSQALTIKALGSEINSGAGNKTTTAAALLPDLQFFPESGSLVNNITSKVAFKAVSPDGLGIDFEGYLIDNNGTKLQRVSSTHIGMGYFYLTPQNGVRYKVVATFKNGREAIYNIPVALSKGITFTVNNDSSTMASVKIISNKLYFNENKGKDYTLLIYSGGKVTTVWCPLDSNIITLDILKRKLFTGVTQITLFSPLAEPLAERIMFVQKYDQLKFNLSFEKVLINDDLAKINVKLMAKNNADSTISGHFSVSVLDESKIPIAGEDDNILSYLLLTSDLKGYIEKPANYFESSFPNVLQDLDLVMLTHGYRKWDWKEVINNINSVPTFEAEQGLQIAGQVKNFSGRPLPQATVNLLPSNGAPFLTTKTNAEGKFCFKNIEFADSAQFVLQAVDQNGKSNTQLSMNSNYALNDSFFKDYTNKDHFSPLIPIAPERQGKTNESQLSGNVLKEVKIYARKKTPVRISKYWGVADQVIKSDLINIPGSLIGKLAALLRGVRFVSVQDLSLPVSVNSINSSMAIVINDQEMQKDFNLNSIDPMKIEMIEAMTNPSAGNGALIITMKNPRDYIKSTGILPINVEGYYVAKSFYIPKYESVQKPVIDWYKTVLWVPELQTGKDGQATFYYYSNSKDKFRIIIEGIGLDGSVGRKVIKY